MRTIPVNIYLWEVFPVASYDEELFSENLGRKRGPRHEKSNRKTQSAKNCNGGWILLLPLQNKREYLFCFLNMSNLAIYRTLGGKWVNGCDFVFCFQKIIKIQIKIQPKIKQQDNKVALFLPIILCVTINKHNILPKISRCISNGLPSYIPRNSNSLIKIISRLLLLGYYF